MRLLFYWTTERATLLTAKQNSAQLEVLNTLEKNDQEGRFHCVNLLEWFDYRGHVCMAFEKLGLSLYDFLRRNGYSPFHVNLVSAAAVQNLHASSCLTAQLQVHQRVWVECACCNARFHSGVASKLLELLFMHWHAC